MAQGEAGSGLKTRLADQRALLGDCMVRDRRRLAVWMERLARRGAAVDPREVERLESQVRVSLARVRERRESMPRVSYDDTLPVHFRREAIAEAIKASQFVIVSGATGSGKSTQLPKICLELGRGAAGMIGHTQPRRIAAQALASRLSGELGSVPGELVGYQVRFVDRTSPRTLVKLMTDGLLLRELEGDPLLERYDTLILDEAHERNLNVDFLLGVCKQIAGRRPDLRVIVTSATIETARFAEYFGGAPVVDVEGRSYPVEVRYRPLREDDADAPSLPEAVAAALDELQHDARGLRGDALVFLPGERQIAECREFLERPPARDWDVLPLYARLSAVEQERIFAPHERRRVVLATNVAETSLTIPAVRFVVDSGLARVSRYSARAKFQRLPIEPVSRASADQRKGRCGRIGEGICIRLYSEEDFEARPRYTDPEILRTNLASLILQMAALGLGAPEQFPFLDAPDTRLLNDGYRLLQELSAVDGDRRITRLGRQMAGLPVDSRLARVLIESGRLQCLNEALVVASFLSIQDPRERPADKTEAADEKHARFADERSDFVAVLNLWNGARAEAQNGNRALRRWCREHFLSFPRMREWQDLRDQLGEITDALKLPRNPAPAAPGVLHQAILTGFLGGIGVLDANRTYLGARDVRFVIAPGTPLARRAPRWIVAASLVETQRLYARMVAQVQPSWIESAAAHLVRRIYGEARWVPERGMVVATETVSLYGRVLSSGREVNFATVDPAMARRIFVEEALVRRSGPLRTAFLDRNEELRRDIERLEAKLRRRDLLAGEGRIVDFYLERIPPDVTGIRAFERWWRDEERRHPHRLDVPRELLLAEAPPAFDATAFPDTWELDGNALRVDYVFDPTHPDDGVTLEIPLPLLGALHAEQLDWIVPGLLRDKVVALLRGLPKDLRRDLVPIPDAAERFLGSVAADPGGDLIARLARFVTEVTGRATTGDAFDPRGLPPWLLVRLSVVDSSGRELRHGRDLGALRRELRVAAGERQFAGSSHAWERDGLRRWDFGELPGEVRVRMAGLSVRLYPGIEDAGTSVSLRLYPVADQARIRTRNGVTRLAALAMPQQHDYVKQMCAGDRDLALLAASSGSGKVLFADLADRAVEEALAATGLPQPTSSAMFETLVEAAGGLVTDCAVDLLRLAKSVLLGLKEARAALVSLGAPVYSSATAGMNRQLEALLCPGWLRQTPDPWLHQLPRYVRAIARRAERLRSDVERDRRLEAQVLPYVSALHSLDSDRDDAAPGPERERLRWMIEEFRVSLFAQDLRTLRPVSAKRLDEQLGLARKEAGR